MISKIWRSSASAKALKKWATYGSESLKPTKTHLFSFHVIIKLVRKIWIEHDWTTLSSYVMPYPSSEKQTFKNPDHLFEMLDSEDAYSPSTLEIKWSGRLRRSWTRMSRYMCKCNKFTYTNTYISTYTYTYTYTCTYTHTHVIVYMYYCTCMIHNV